MLSEASAAFVILSAASAASEVEGQTEFRWRFDKRDTEKWSVVERC